jgi:hypothetical protein
VLPISIARGGNTEPLLIAIFCAVEFGLRGVEARARGLSAAAAAHDPVLIAPE